MDFFLCVLQTCQVKGYFSKQLLPRRRRKAQKDIQSDLVPLSQGNMLQKKKLSATYCGKSFAGPRGLIAMKICAKQITCFLISRLVYLYQWSNIKCIMPDKTQSRCSVCKMTCPPALPP